ncbi:MAG: CDP-diacylglycerol--glycerol-3-phosphate 3-phosphatidyltransferase [Clostridia bacterium]|nr:CDP-diacylglycerol--glycerol-3-phosphate 3-phosphatidyltransferase [Clostridia bacterium]
MKNKLKELLKDCWNLPNTLTMFRLVLVPFFILLYLDGHPYQALGVFCLASLTDMFDGYLARKNNQITSFGKLVDPLADKLLVVSALICHGWRNVFPWSAIILVVIKEIAMIVGSLFLLGKKDVVVHSNYWGKTSTCFFIAALILGFFHDDLAGLGFHLDIWLLWISVISAYCAAITYAHVLYTHVKKKT